jgi:phenylacetate-coenzyme A ligase PaaK-like adenylate-forming protein
MRILFVTQIIPYPPHDGSSWLGQSRYCGRYAEYERLLEKSQRWDTQQLRDWQDTRLRDLIQDAGENVPWDGRIIPPSVLTHPFKQLDSIDASQLVQPDLDHLIVRLVPRADYSESHATHLVRELKARLGEDMHIDIELVDQLPRTASGKFKWVVSHVDLGI